MLADLSGPSGVLPMAWPHLLGLDMTTVVCSWYGFTNYYQQHLLPMDFEQPKAKRRKLDNCATGSNSSHLSASNSASEVTRLKRRGQVTFKPYNDTSDHGSLLLHGRRRGSSVFGECPNELTRGGALKRKHGEAISVDPRRGENSKDWAHNKKCQEAELLKGTTIGNLFPEILSNIFQYVDVKTKGRCARVCKTWRDAVYRKSVWRKVEARIHIGKANPYLYPSLVQRGITRVQVLSLRKSLRELINGIPNLESLNLSGCYNLTDAALDGAFNKDVPCLKALNLSLCKEISDNSIGRIATHCKNLEVLDLGGCAKITNTGLLLISWGLRHIRKLNLRSCRLISDIGIGHLAGIDDEACQASSNLEEIILQDCQKLTDESLRHIADGLARVQRINLSFCVSVTDTGLKSLSRLSSLEGLNLRSCDNVSDIGIGFLAEDAQALKCLDVSFCTNVTDAAMKHIAVGMTGLQSLSMTTCTISDSGLKRLSEALKSLEDLNIGQCVALTDEGLAHVTDKMKSLRSLDLYGCPKVTNTSLDKIRKMPNMTRLNLEL